MPLVQEDFLSQIFWSTTDILNFVRILVNDTQNGLAGQELSDANPRTWPLLNLCYAKLQNALEDLNVESVTIQEWRVGPLPATDSAASDPSIVCRLGYDGFDSGDGFQYETPKLPPDLLEPLDIMERPGGSIQPFTPMVQKLGMLPQSAGTGPYRFWDFRQNSVYFPASTSTNELRLRGIPAWPLLTQPNAGEPPALVKLARSGEALAYMVAAEWAEIRNAPNQVALRAKALEQIQILANKSAKRSNQADTRRRGYGFRRSRVSWLWPVR